MSESKTSAGVIESIQEGSFLSRICSYEFGHDGEARKALADTICSLANAGELNFFEIFSSEKLNQLASHDFFTVQHTFCDCLPNIEAPILTIVDAVKAVVAIGGEDLMANEPNRAFREWCTAKPERADEALQHIKLDLDRDTGVTTFVLEAGFQHDPERYFTEAIAFVTDDRDHICLPAITSLGRMEFKDNKDFLTKTLDTLSTIVSTSENSIHVANALIAALNQLNKSPKKLKKIVSKMVCEASSHDDSQIRYALSLYLHPTPKHITEEAAQCAWEALTKLGNNEGGTLRNLDVALSHHDLSAESDKISEFLVKLLSRDESEISLEQFSSFIHKVRGQDPKLIAWYAVRFLLSGNHRLCEFSNDFCGYDEKRTGYDLDLGAFALSDDWLNYLSHKAIGYGLLRPRLCFGILIAVLRSTSFTLKKNVSELLFDPLILNYLSLTEHLRVIASDNSDTAQEAAREILQRVEAYEMGLKSVGKIEEFQPSERERHVRQAQDADASRAMQKDVHEKSVLLSLIHKSIMLYGRRSVSYIDPQNGEEPRRSEMPLASHSYEIEVPRLEILDPVGQNYQLFQFRIEKAPDESAN